MGVGPHRGTVVAIYTFYPCRDSQPASFEAHEADGDEAAMKAAHALLAAHPSCDSVEVWEGERFLGAYAPRAVA